MYKYKLLFALLCLFLVSPLFSQTEDLTQEQILSSTIDTAKNKKQQLAAQQNLIVYYMSNKKYNEAKNICIPLIDTDSKLSKKEKFQIYMYLIDIYKLLNNYGAAIETCKEAEFLYPKNIIPKIILADIYMDNILYENAKNKYQEALLIDKKSRHANVKIADIYAMQGAFNLAFKHYKIAQDIQPDVCTSIKLAKSAMELGMADEALKLLEQVFAVEINCDIAVHLSNLYKEHGRFKDAEKTLLTALKFPNANKDDDLELILNLASLYILFQHYDKAKPILLSAKNKFGNLEIIDFMLADTYYSLGDSKTAVKLLKDIIAKTKSEYIKKHSENMLNTYK